MNTQLSITEVQQLQQLFQAPDSSEINEIQTAIATLAKYEGELEASFDELWSTRVGDLETYAPKGQSLWKVTLQVLRREICEDDGFRGKVKEYTKNPGSAPLLTGAIVSLVTIATAHGVPIDPAIATIIVLYILKIGLNIFCEYTEPSKSQNPPA
ncbi:MAG: hypothetical protein KME07_11805 [Pegethrix bostrychoides GSE-TBD4-15B]|jgi:hypothetical protein|uniref:Uncharacterized protein n=1 Tax=Pegethrix bostrychoides GSE-TBD4-15B TaxID=2839662 RepID=A0A951PBG9_9CYAN|nr:hypothetical protein [Pegethrix bostrychoides GSE-TBD4-15B]